MVRYRMRSPSEGQHQGPGQDHEREEQGQGQELSPERVEDYGRTERGHHHRHRRCKRLHRIHKRRRSCRRRRRHSCRHRRRHRRGKHPVAKSPATSAAAHEGRGAPLQTLLPSGQPRKPELFSTQAAEDPEGGGAAGAGNAGGTIIKPPQADPFCLELRKSPASGSHLPKQSHVRPQHHSMLISEP